MKLGVHRQLRTNAMISASIKKAILFGPVYVADARAYPGSPCENVGTNCALALKSVGFGWAPHSGENPHGPTSGAKAQAKLGQTDDSRERPATIRRV